LQKLVEPFGLAATGLHLKKQKWHALDDRIGMTKTPAGQTWLNGCKLRVYGPEDYLICWRRYFAGRLGFSVIPGGGDEGEPVPAADDDGVTKIESATHLDCWTRRAGTPSPPTPLPLRTGGEGRRTNRTSATGSCIRPTFNPPERTKYSRLIGPREPPPHVNSNGRSPKPR
jgi:hypothetical protein